MEQCLAQEAKIFNFFFKGMHRVQEFLLLFFVFFFVFFFGIQITLYEAMFSAGRQRNV